jgi:hypothetical protein
VYNPEKENLKMSDEAGDKGNNNTLLYAALAVVGIMGFIKFQDKFLENNGSSGYSKGGSLESAYSGLTGGGYSSSSGSYSSSLGSSSPSGSARATSVSAPQGEGDAAYNAILHHHDGVNVAPGFAPGTHLKSHNHEGKLKEEAREWVQEAKKDLQHAGAAAAAMLGRASAYEEVLTSFPHLHPDKTSDWK